MTVYVVQNQRAVDGRGALKQKFDLTPARKFGDLVELLPEYISPFTTDEIVKTLQLNLRSFTDEDFLLLIGNPVIIGLAVAVASVANAGHVQMLQWNGVRREYIPVRARGLADLPLLPSGA